MHLVPYQFLQTGTLILFLVAGAGLAQNRKLVPQASCDEIFEGDHRSLTQLVEQLAKDVQAGELSPFYDLYLLTPHTFRVDSFADIFMSGASGLDLSDDPLSGGRNHSAFSHFDPLILPKIVSLLKRNILNHPRGLISVGSVDDAHELARMLSKTIPARRFATSQSIFDNEQEVHCRFQNKQIDYLVTTEGLDEIASSSDFSFYIDLNRSEGSRRFLQRLDFILRSVAGRIEVVMMTELSEIDLRELLAILDREVSRDMKDTQSWAMLAQIRARLIAMRDVQRSTRLIPPFEEWDQLVRSLGITNGTTYDSFLRIGKLPAYFPASGRLYKVYRGKFNGWPGFRGAKLPVRDLESPSFEVWEREVRKLGVQDGPDYSAKKESGQLPANFPSVKDLYRVYQSQFNGWPGFRGERSRLNSAAAPTFQEWDAEVRRLDIQKESEYQAHRKSGQLPAHFPQNFHRVYKGKFKGWASYRGVSPKSNEAPPLPKSLEAPETSSSEE